MPPRRPTVNKGDTAWMLVSTMLVILMTIPGLALFYGGLVRTKNMLSVLTQVFAVFCLVAHPVGGLRLLARLHSGGGSARRLHRRLLEGVPGRRRPRIPPPPPSPRAWHSGIRLHGVPADLCRITPALIVGAFAERMKFSAVMLFIVLWFTFVYLPIAHMVWFSEGYLFGLGALDFAGGTVVHINSGVAGLVGALLVGKRIGYGREPMAPHSLTLTFIGACLLWVGWFGFNAGSNLEANGLRGARAAQHHRRAGRGGPRLDDRWRRSPRASLAARHRLGRGRGPRGRSPRPPALPARWARSCSASLPASSASSR